MAKGKKGKKKNGVKPGGLGEKKLDKLSIAKESKSDDLKKIAGNANIEKVDEKKVDKKKVDKKKSLSEKIPGCVWSLLWWGTLLVAGICLGVWFYPKAMGWLSDHGFMEKDTLLLEVDTLLRGDGAETADSQYSLQTENIVTEIASQSVDGVVSIAVTEVALTRDGVVDQRSEIGSGFVVDERGLVVTNQHVVSDVTADYIVVSSDGIEYSVQKIHSDDVNDIALLEVDLESATVVNENVLGDTDESADINAGDASLKALELGDTDGLKVGQLVIAIGTPLGDFGGSVTTGVISGLHRSVTTGQSGFWGMAKVYEDVIQTDAAINPGNSGGPLLDSNGKVIGVSFATIGNADNISFALPINFVKTRLDEYHKYGKFIKPYLGVQYEIITPMQARFYNGVQPGAFVTHVAGGSPAAEAGIKKGDIVLEFGGVRVLGTLSGLVQQHKVDEEVDVVLWRDSEEVSASVILGEK